MTSSKAAKAITPQPETKSKPKAISKTISLPDDLVEQVEREIISKDDELDWSKHIRKLVRADLLSRTPVAA